MGSTLGEDVGSPLESVKVQDLGRAGRIEAGKEALFVVNGGGGERAIRERISAWRDGSIACRLMTTTVTSYRCG